MSPATDTRPKTVIDPELPDAVAGSIRTMTPDELANLPTKDHSVWWGVWEPVKCGAKICGAAVVFALVLPQAWEALRPQLSGFVGPGVSVLVIWAGWSVLNRKGERDRRRTIRGHRERYIFPEDLETDAAELMARTQEAVRTVTRSVLHREGLIDGQRSAQLLPAQEWDIAVSLRDYSRLVRKTPKDPKGEAAQAVLAERRRLLKLSREGIEQQVTALETYAEQVAKAERLYAETQQLKQISEGDEELLDLLARTARHELGAEEAELLTGEVAAVVTAYTTALKSAKEAAAIALPAASPDPAPTA